MQSDLWARRIGAVAASKRWRRIALHGAAALVVALLGVGIAFVATHHYRQAIPAPVDDLPAPAATAAALKPALPTAASTPAGAVTSSLPSAPPGAPSRPLADLALQAGDVPAGFVVMTTGPLDQVLGSDVLAGYEEEFGPADVMAADGLQKTIVILDLLGRYKDATSARNGLQVVTSQSLNQLLGSNTVTMEPAATPPIGESSSGLHFSGSTKGGAVGGYLIAVQSGPTVALVVTAAARGAESLPQTVDLAQKQAQRLSAGG
jgi:hypothetical protein